MFTTSRYRCRVKVGLMIHCKVDSESEQMQTFLILCAWRGLKTIRKACSSEMYTEVSSGDLPFKLPSPTTILFPVLSFSFDPSVIITGSSGCSSRKIWKICWDSYEEISLLFKVKRNDTDLGWCFHAAICKAGKSCISVTRNWSSWQNALTREAVVRPERL